MKTKFKGILTLFLALVVQVSFAQDRTISGTVSDETGPLPGVSILKKGTTQGTETDFDGNYTIKAKSGDILIFSFVGMETVEKTISGSNRINVVMQSSNVLEEVVVTALGLEKKKDEDLSSSTKVDTENLQRSGEAGVLQGLSGKTSGVNITKSSGDPGAGAYIQIRGQNTISGNIQPLIVLDGVIVSNDNVGGGTDGVTQQSRLNDIPSDDIKSVTVLKGAAAAAIYGTGAANGVLVIQTKSGKARGGKRWAVNVKTAVSIDEINREWEKQSTFGQGTKGKYLGDRTGRAGYHRRFANGTSWGDKISDRPGGADGVVVGNERFVSETGKIYYPYSINPITKTVNKNSRAVYNKSNRDAIFGTGIAFDNSVGLSHAGENTNTYISFSRWQQEGIIKAASDYIRNTIRFNHEVNFSDKFKGKISSSYIDINSNRVQQGSNLNGLYLGYLRTPADFDHRDYKGVYYNSAGERQENSHRAFRDYLGTKPPAYNSPLWTLYEQTNTSDVSRFIVAPELSYIFNDNISLTARYGVDFYVDDRITFFPYNSGGRISTGSYESEKLANRRQTWNIFFNGNHELSKNADFSWILGYQSEKRNYSELGGKVTNFANSITSLEDIKDFGNGGAENQTPSDYYLNTSSNALYAVLNATLFDQLFLEVSGRAERMSTIPDNLIFYPSGSIGWQFSKMTGTNDTFSFGKLRLSYGEVGIAPPAYGLSDSFEVDNVRSTWGDILEGAQFGPVFERKYRKGNPNLKEERVKEFEIGADLRFLNNRLTLGATYYDRTTEDAVLTVGLPSSTGYTETFDNAAEMTNKGVEIDLSGSLVRTEDFEWKVNINFSKNNNLITKLTGADYIRYNGFTSTSSGAKEGYPSAVIYGGRWLRDKNGKILLDENGFADESPTPGVLGDPNPDWRGGVSTSLNWKGLSISALVETSQGNKVWNGTKGVMYYFGVHPDTANEVTVSAADAGKIINFKGIPINQLEYAKQNADGSYTVRGNLKDFGAGTRLLDQDWYTNRGGGFGNAREQFVEDGSWVKLREISLNYSLPKKYIENTLFQSIDFGITGRNLFTWSKVKGFDPESNLTGASRGRGLEYFTNPSTSSYVMTLKFGF